jgi:hypothetical protein
VCGGGGGMRVQERDLRHIGRFARPQQITRATEESAFSSTARDTKP